ncbi:MAG: hypothetical protein RBS48_00040 [Ignavibacteriaceae bacterium]|jgi:hypothetical protein|nr:hypothetical protein [Ignavibacteriaceae bacterium]
MNKIYKKIGYMLLKMRYSKKDRAQLNIKEKFLNSEIIVFIFPKGGIEYSSYSYIINFFLSIGKKAIFIIEDNKTSSFPILSGTKFLTYNENDLSRYGLPKKEFLEKYKKERKDLVIDLNYEDDFFATTISASSSNCLSIGYFKEYSELFYDIIINTSDNFSDRGKYIVNLLMMFSNK